MSGHLDGPPPGPPDPPYIPGDLGAPSAEEFARRRASSEPRPDPVPLDRIVCAFAPDDYLTLDLDPEPAGEPPIAGLRCTQGGTGSQVTLTPETARALGEALVAWSANPPVRQVDRNGEPLEPDDLVVIWHPEGDPIALARWTGEIDRCGYLKLRVEAHRSSTSHGEGVWRPGVLTKVIA